ncbi:MAG: GGDEF domain-containing protein [Burkholderiaceae bacterium]|jgi:diguanylate cyclase (GGDEF)-like protein
MHLDVPTLFVALFCAFALFSLALSCARPFLGDRLEIRLWERASWVLVAGFIVLFARRLIPEAYSVVIGNSLLYFSLYLSSQALHRFVLLKAAPPWQLGLMIVGWGCTIGIVDAPLNVRTIVLSTVFAVQLVPMLGLLVRFGWHREPSLRTVALTFALTMLALWVRVGNALWYPAEYGDYFQSSLGNSLTYLASFLLPLGAGFGFVLANLERMASRLDQLAIHDPLTGALGRSAFDRELSHNLEMHRRSGQTLSLIVVAVENLEHINDAQGHDAGDNVLREAVRALRASLRDGAVLGRLSGVEFGVIAPNADPQKALKIAEELREAALALDILDTSTGVTKTLRVSTSIGISSVRPESFRTSEVLYSEANEALDIAKFSGRNRAEHYGLRRAELEALSALTPHPVGILA